MLTPCGRPEADLDGPFRGSYCPPNVKIIEFKEENRQEVGRIWLPLVGSRLDCSLPLDSPLDPPLRSAPGSVTAVTPCCVREHRNGSVTNDRGVFSEIFMVVAY